MIAAGLSRTWHWIVRRTLSLWVRATVKPDDAARELASAPRPLCYVLERESDADLALLGIVCGRLNLPRPTRRLLAAGRRTGPAFFELARRPRWFARRGAARAPRHLRGIIAAAAADARFDADLVPVAIFWGRAPHKEAGWWRLMFADHWALAGRFRKLLTVAFNGRNALVHFGNPQRLRDATRGAWCGPCGRRCRRSAYRPSDRISRTVARS